VVEEMRVVVDIWGLMPLESKQGRGRRGTEKKNNKEGLQSI
jgi:hypothetical protein